MGADPTATAGEDAVRVVAVVRLRLLVATAVVVVVEKETLAAAVVVVAAAVVADVRWGDDSFGLAAAVATRRRQFWLGGCGCDQFLVHYGGLVWLLWHVPTIRWVVVLYLVLAYYWWYRVAHCEINRSMIASHPGTHPPTLVARDKQTKEALAQRLWGWAASPIGLTSWIFHVLVLQQEQFYDKVFSMTCYWYQQINCQYNGQTSDFIKRVHLGQFILETSLVLYFTEVRGTEVLYFDFGSVAYQHPNGLLTRYEHLTALVDPKTSVAMIYRGDPKDSTIHDTPLPVSEAAFVLMFFWSTGAHVPAHMYGTWVSRIPESQRDDVVFWMHQCSNAMIVESRSWVPTFTTNVNHYWSVPSATSHTRVLDFNSRPVMKHSALRSNELLGASRLCQFMVALRATVFRVFEKHKVRYDPELLLATIFHSLDHYGAWVHRIPSCYKYDDVDYHHFWETQVRGSHCLLVDTRMKTAPVKYLREIYESMLPVDPWLAGAMHFAISW